MRSSNRRIATVFAGRGRRQRLRRLADVRVPEPVLNRRERNLLATIPKSGPTGAHISLVSQRAPSPVADTADGLCIVAFPEAGGQRHRYERFTALLGLGLEFRYGLGTPTTGRP
jgi:hypothetical protein